MSKPPNEWLRGSRRLERRNRLPAPPRTRAHEYLSRRCNELAHENHEVNRRNVQLLALMADILQELENPTGTPAESEERARRVRRLRCLLDTLKSL